LIVTSSLLQRHRGTLNCKACGRPIREGEPAVRRRVNNNPRYFHPGCIYAEAKQAEEAEGDEITSELLKAVGAVVRSGEAEAPR